MDNNKHVILDSEQLESLRELNEPGSKDIVTELIDIFLEQSPETLDNLKDQIGQQNGNMVEKLAHKLKGSSANLGAEYLRWLCQKAEEYGRAKDYVQLEKLVVQIEKAFDEVCEILKRDWRKPAA